MTIVPDIPRLYTAFAECCACFVYICTLQRRLSTGKLVLAALLNWSALSLLLGLTSSDILERFLGQYAILLWLPCMFAAIFIMYLCIRACCGLGWRSALYYTVRAFVLAELAASLGWQLHLFFFSGAGRITVVSAVCLAGYCVATCAAVWLAEGGRSGPQEALNVQNRELASSVIMGLVIFAVSNLSFTRISTPFSAQYPTEVLNVRTLVDLGGFALLFAHHVQCRQARAQREVESLQSVVQNQYTQYKLSRDSIEVINRKYHDMKHQIAALRAETDPQKRNAWLDSMEQDIKTYEAQNKTGNPVLDTVLTGKSLYCQNHGIALTCVVDGALLRFMDAMDLCSLFGNALDNAIECELQIADKEKRLIHVTVAQQHNFVLLRFENYLEAELNIENGLPRTTKRNKDFHGYGLKSIWQIAQKYGGNASLQTEAGWFELTVLIPLQNAD